MGFRVRRALAVFRKDLLDLSKNRGLVASMLVLPAMLVLVPTAVVYAYATAPDDPNYAVVAQYYQARLEPGISPARFLIDRTLMDWFGMYLLMPVFVPILISSQSVAGEKERRTIEPLLASPLSAAELLAGKSLAALVPALGISWGAFVALCLGVNVVGWPVAHELLMPNGLWLFGVLVIAPLFAFFGNGVAVVVSARVADARLAQQLSALVTLPLMGLVGSQVAGFLRAGPEYYALQGAVVLVLDVLLVLVGVRLFDRERLVSRWT